MTEDETPDRRLGNSLGDAHQAAVFAQRALEEHRYAEAAQHAKYGLQHPASTPRSMLILATAQWHLGQKNAARVTAEDLMRAWLDPAVAILPVVHPRKAIDRGEMISLVRLTEGGQAAPLVERIQSAPEIEEAGGDFL